VTDIVDGDTVRAQTLAGRDLGRIRLLGIDAPETAYGTDPAESYGDATQLLAELVPPAPRHGGQRPRQPDREDYGRLLRHVDHRSDDLAETLLDAAAVRLYDSGPPLTRAADHKRAAEVAATMPAAFGASTDPAVRPRRRAVEVRPSLLSKGAA
jgi:endonuclease YncB( thermonuclease family)